MSEIKAIAALVSALSGAMTRLFEDRVGRPKLFERAHMAIEWALGNITLPKISIMSILIFAATNGGTKTLSATIFHLAMVALLGWFWVVFYPKLQSRKGDTVIAERETLEAYSTAIHESGHAVLAVLSKTPQIAEVCIEREGDSLGRLRWRHDGTILADYEGIAISMAGAAAEAIVFGKWRSGSCSHDLEEARRNARRIIEKVMFDKNMSPPRGWEGLEVVKVSFDVATAFKTPLSPLEKGLLELGYRKAKKELLENRKFLDRCAVLLLTQGKVYGPELRQLQSKIQET